MPDAFEALGGWPGVLGPLSARTDLSADQTEAAMTEILSGVATSAQIAGFIVALRMKGETADELAGLLRAMFGSARLVPLEARRTTVDIVGTGGDRSHSINVSTLAALVVAGAGGTVCKHGNRSASSRCGSADLLEAMGVVIDLGPDGVAQCVARARLGFCFAPVFHSAMRHAAATRRELGVPTVFNLLGPLANPGRVGRYLVGVNDGAMAERMARALHLNGAEHALVVHGDDGLDELTTTTTSTVVEMIGGEIRTFTVDPAELGLAPASLEELRGGGVADNVRMAEAVLDGRRGPHRDVVVLNSAAALVVAGLATGLGEGIVTAQEALDTGRAASALERLVAASTAARKDGLA